jgi:diacylglycerol kinase (ATP)
MSTPPKTVLALIAHDCKKDELIQFTQRHATLLAKHHLIATGTTGQRIQAAAGLSVECLQSGPLGGDAQIAARVVEGQVSAVIFLIDPLCAQPHEPDIATLQRLCNLHDVPLATNLSTAEIVAQHLMQAEQAGDNLTTTKHLELDLARSRLAPTHSVSIRDWVGSPLTVIAEREAS